MKKFLILSLMFFGCSEKDSKILAIELHEKGIHEEIKFVKDYASQYPHMKRIIVELNFDETKDSLKNMGFAVSYRIGDGLYNVSW